MDELPIAQGLFVCERVGLDPLTRNPTLVNRFTTIRAGEFPTRPRPFSVFTVLTNGFGDIRISLIITHLESDTEVYKGSDIIQFANRLQEVPFLATLTELLLPVAGTYELTLYAEDEPLAGCRLRATRREMGGQS
jgi:hypothetical protein